MAALPDTGSNENDLKQRLEAGLGKDKPIKVWLDSDCVCFTEMSTLLDSNEKGHENDPDDGWALCAILNSDRCELIGVSSTYGNDTEEIAFRDLTKALSLHEKGKNINVYHGAKLPLSAFTGISRYIDTGSVSTRTNAGVEAMKTALESLEKDEKLVIYADGPGTNVATLLLLYPKLQDKIDFIVLFMGRDTVSYPVFGFGDVSTKLNQYFSDFNFELDRYSVEVLIKSGVSLVFAGAELAKNSMWLYEHDLKNIYNNVSKNVKNKLIQELSNEKNYLKWLELFRKFGNYLPPWDKNNPGVSQNDNKTTINGFVPFGILSASVLFGSERLKYRYVNPSLPIVKNASTVAERTPRRDPTGTKVENATFAPEKKVESKEETQEDVNVNVNVTAASGGDEQKTKEKPTKTAPGPPTATARATGQGYSNMPVDERKRDEVTKRLQNRGQEAIRLLRRHVGSFHNAQRTLNSLAKHELKKRVAKHDSSNENGVESTQLPPNFDVLRWLDAIGKRVDNMMADQHFFYYCLCTNDEPQGDADNVWSHKPAKRNNILYVPSAAGDYPFNDYKKFVLDLLQKD